MTQLVYTYTITVNAPEDWNKVNQNFTDIKTVVNALDNSNLSGSAGITGANLASGTVADTNLASPNNATYKEIMGGGGTNLNLVNGTTYMMMVAGGANGSGTGFVGSAMVAGKYIDPADYTVAGKTTKYRVRASAASNAQAALSTFTFGLYPVTIGGAAGSAPSFTLGTVVAGSTAALVAPSVSTVSVATGSDFTAPSAAFYVLGFVVSVQNQAVNNNLTFRAELQCRQV